MAGFGHGDGMIASLLLTVASITAPSADCATRLEQARAAYGVYDVAAAERAYAALAAASCPSDVTGVAETEMARIAWLVHNRPADAIDRLKRVLPSHPDPCGAAVLLGRILSASGRPSETSAALMPYRERCAALESGVLLEIIKASVDQAAAGPLATRRPNLETARAMLGGLSELARASLAGARLRLAIGLGLADRALALEGWRDFYWLDATVKPQAFGGSDAEVRRTFEAGLAPGASEFDRLALVKLLIRGGFADEAERLIDGRAKGEAWKAPLAYLEMRRRLAALLLAHDRAWARGERPDDAPFEANLVQALKDAVAAAGHPADDPWPALRELWGLFGTTGRSNGVSGLHLGHVSTDRSEEVRQSRRQGEVRFISLDNMIANGFSGWLGDGTFAPGGWAADGQIIQVRARYVQSALDWAAVASGGPARERYLALMERRSAGDADIARTEPIAFLPGLADRIRVQAIDALARELRVAGDDPATFPRRFARLWYDRSFEGTIHLHEGRHALDQLSYAGAQALSDDELEYRAKLSELRYSTSPRVMLGSIYGRLIGGTTGHGIANERLLRDLIAWMREHKEAVDGFDSGRCQLCQLDLLSDAQLRMVAESLDPETR